METDTLQEETEPQRRLWLDLERRRLAIGLAAAPLLPAAIGSPLIPAMVTPLVQHSPATAGNLVLHFAVVTGGAIIWSLAFGTFFLITSPRRSGAITRGQCLFVGGLAVILFPAVFVAFFGLATNPAIAVMVIAIFPMLLLVGLFLTPLGVLGGWVFWRVGVKPAKWRVDKLEQVFQ